MNTPDTPLPILPAAEGLVWYDATPHEPGWLSNQDAYTEGQMENYARAALAAQADEHAAVIGRLKDDCQAWARDYEALQDTVAAQAEEIASLRADAERLRIRGEAYETAYGIAYQATYQSHNGHWDATMRGGLGCRECIKAREARENCDAALRDGLEKLVERALKGQP